MSSYVRWKDIRAEHVVRAGGEEAVAAGKDELLVEGIGCRRSKAKTSSLSPEPKQPTATFRHELSDEGHRVGE